MSQSLHVCPSPFPRQLSSTRTVVDEICHCGGFRSEHEDTLLYGNGKCVKTGCRQFTWTDFVVEVEGGG